MGYFYKKLTSEFIDSEVCYHSQLFLLVISGTSKTLIITGTTPAFIISNSFAAATDRSIIQPGPNGPLSVISTSTVFPFFLFVTRTTVPNGNVLCAAVNLFLS